MTMISSSLALLILLLISGCIRAEKSFFEAFQYENLEESGWKKSVSAQAGGEWGLSQGDSSWHGHDENDFGLIAKSQAQRHAMSKHLEAAIDPHGTPEIVIQYEVRFHNHMECGGSYLKALSVPEDQTEGSIDSETPYSIMFGPDKCGATDKVHFIIKHQSPVTEKWTEHHAKKVPAIINDRFTHLYRLEIYANNSFVIKIDDIVKSEGNLLSPTDFEPPVIPPETIPDPDDKKPETWNDQAKISDPNQTKPADWDENQPKMIKDEKAVKPETWDENAPLKIPDPEAVKPEDWDDEEDGNWSAPFVENPDCEHHGCGPWTAPLIPNPLYQGKWKPDLIDNPDYDGIWAPRQIPNPEYFTTDDATKGMAMITDAAFEIWTMQSGVEFDNIYIGYSVSEADKYATDYFIPKHDKEVTAHAKIAPSEPELGHDSDGKADGAWFVQQIQTLLKSLSPYFETVSDNPLPFIVTFLAGIIVFVIYMFKQVRPATNELMQQAQASKAVMSGGKAETDPRYAPADKSDDASEDEENSEDDE